MSQESVVSIRSVNVKVPTAEAARRHAEGQSLREIAEAFGASRTAVFRALRRAERAAKAKEAQCHDPL